MTSYPFSRWRPAAILDLIWVMLDDPQSEIVDLNLILNLVLIGFVVSEIMRFLYFGILDVWLIIAIHAHFLEFLERIPPMMLPFVLTLKRTILKRTILTQKHVVWAVKLENLSSDSTCVQDREKKDRTLTVQKGKKFAYLVKISHCIDLNQNLCGGQSLWLTHVCKVSRWNFQGLRFYGGGGSNLTVLRYCAARETQYTKSD